MQALVTPSHPHVQYILTKTHTLIKTWSSFRLLLLSTCVYLFSFHPLLSLCWGCCCYNVKVKKGIRVYSNLSLFTLESKRLIQTMTVSFLVPSEFMRDCSTIWSRPIYSRLPPLPPPPCSLKVTPGDFGRGVLELLCQCEALQWQVCWWGWSLWSRTAPFSPLKQKGCFCVHP